MANYNNGHFIDEAILSIIKQTFTDWELIIVDDASTDDSVDKIKKYLHDARIRLFIRNKNEGYTKAQIFGLKKVNSELVGILDSDDALVSDAIEKVYSVYMEKPELGLVLSQGIFCNAQLKPLQTSINSSKHLKELAFPFISISFWRTFKLSDYCACSGLDPSILYAEDWDLIFKIQEVAPSLRVDEPLYMYRQIPTSQSKSAFKFQVGFRSLGFSIYKAYLRRLMGDTPLRTSIPKFVVLRWLAGSVRLSIELGQPFHALLFAIRSFIISPFNTSSYRCLKRAISGINQLVIDNIRHKKKHTINLNRRFLPLYLFQSASGNLDPDQVVCIPHVHRQGHCLFGGDFSVLEGGNYKVFFEINVKHYPFAEDPILVFDIYENLQLKRVIAEKEVNSTDINTLQRQISLEFEAKEGYRIEFRIFWDEQCFLTVSGVVLEYLGM